MSAPAVELGEVVPHPAGPGLRFAWEGPVPGPQPHPYSLDFHGWAIGESSPVVRVEIRYGARLIRWTDVSLRHPAHPESRPGYRAAVSLLGLPAAFDLRAEALLENGERHPLGRVTGRRMPLHLGLDPAFSPIVVNHLARSGSTWFMHLLGGHPAIVTQRRYPQEPCFGTHTVRTIETLATPANPPRKQDMERMRGDTEFIGPVPLFSLCDDPASHAWLRSEYVEEIARSGLRMLDLFHRQVAVSQGKGTQVRYFAEKLYTMGRIACLFAEICPGMKHVFLVRDFRDAICSRQSFHRSKGKGADVSLADQIHWMRNKSGNLLETWRLRRETAHIVRYEDLLTSPVETLERLLDYLGLDSQHGETEAWLAHAGKTSPDMQRHQTSRGGLSGSLGRWRREMNPAEQALSAESLGEALAAFGYAVD